MKIKPSIYATGLSAFINLLWVYAVYFVCRLVYGFENWSVLGETMSSDGAWNILKGIVPEC